MQLGSTVTRIGAENQAKADRLAIATARSNVLKADIETRASFADDQDPQTQEKRYRETMQKAVEQASSGLIGVDRALFAQDASVDLERGALAVRLGAKEKETDLGRAQLDETLTTNRGAALAADPATRTSIINATHLALTGAVDKNYMTAEQAGEAWSKWTSSYAEGALTIMPPQERIKALENPAGTPAELVPLDRRVELDDAARRQLLADDELQHRSADRAQSQTEEKNLKDGISLMHAQGGSTLDASWIEAHRNGLTPDAMKFLYDNLTGSKNSEGPRDPGVYSSLLEDAGKGIDVRPGASQAYLRGDIRTSDYNFLYNEVESQRPKGWYLQGVTYLAASSGYSEMNPVYDAAQRKANMLDDWAAWAQANPQTTWEQADAAYKSIAKRYSIVDRDQILMTLAAPQYPVQDKDGEDFDGEAVAVATAFRDGKYGDPTSDGARMLAKREAELIEKRRAAFAAEAQQESAK